MDGMETTLKKGWVCGGNLWLSEQEPETLWIFQSGKRTAFHGGLSNLPFLVKSSGFSEVNKRENITHD